MQQSKTRTLLLAEYDFDTQELEPITQIRRDTALAIAPKWCESCVNPEHYFLAGYNLYAIDNNGNATLIETYYADKEARWARNAIVHNMRSGATMVII